MKKEQNEAGMDDFKKKILKYKRTNVLNIELNSIIKKLEKDYQILFDFRPFDRDFEDWYFDKSCDYYIENFTTNSLPNLFLIEAKKGSKYCIINYNFGGITNDLMGFINSKRIRISNLQSEFNNLMLEIEANCLRAYKLNIINSGFI
jgi:hypothetical protein